MHLTAPCECPQRGYGGDSDRLFTKVQGWRTRDNWHKLNQGSFNLDIRKNFFPENFFHRDKYHNGGAGFPGGMCNLYSWRFPKPARLNSRHLNPIADPAREHDLLSYD